MGVMDKISRWATRPEFQARYGAVVMNHVTDACEEYGIEPEDLDGYIGDRLDNLDGWMFEDFITSPDDEGETVIENYLRRRGFQESATNRAFLAALNLSAVGLYEIVEVRPGIGLTLRDIVQNGEPFEVTERSGSLSLKVWDYIAARVVPVRNGIQLGGGILPIPMVWAPDLALELQESFEIAKDQVRAMFDGVSEGPDVPDIDALSMANFMTAAAPIISDRWLSEYLSRVLGENRPKLLTSDGDILALTTLTFAFLPKAKLTDVKSRLAKIDELERVDRDAWAWPGEAGERPVADKEDHGLVVESWLAPGVFELASVRIEKRAVVLEAKSEERAAWAGGILAEALAGLVEQPSQMITSADDLLDQRRERSAAELTARSPEAEAFRRDWITNHYTEQLDLPVPMLGNKSPRTLSRTPEGRQLLVPWLKGIDNSIAGLRLSEPLDTTWLWAELGMLDERR